MRGPKEKKERALGVHLHVKGERCASPKCALVRKPYPPGAHGNARRKAPSEFGLQLREKQKFKVAYGINERHLGILFKRAARAAGSSAKKIIELLERRLDNAVFRLGIAPSRSMARQLILHGHIAVNGRRVRSPGFEVGTGDEISVREDSKKKNVFKELGSALKKHEPPPWLSIDPGMLSGKVTALPSDTDSPFEINLLVESLSK